MCLGELAVVVGVDGDTATVRGDRGLLEVSVLLVPAVRPGDHVVTHSGHAVSVVTSTAASHARHLRAREHPGSEPSVEVD